MRAGDLIDDSCTWPVRNRKHGGHHCFDFTTLIVLFCLVFFLFCYLCYFFSSISLRYAFLPDAYDAQPARFFRTVGRVSCRSLTPSTPPPSPFPQLSRPRYTSAYCRHRRRLWHRGSRLHDDVSTLVRGSCKLLAVHGNTGESLSHVNDKDQKMVVETSMNLPRFHALCPRLTRFECPPVSASAISFLMCKTASVL
jgi:hypothetical protein